MTECGASGYSQPIGHAITVAVGDGRGFNSMAAAPDGRALAKCSARSWPLPGGHSPTRCFRSRFRCRCCSTRPGRLSPRTISGTSGVSACCRSSSSSTPAPEWPAQSSPAELLKLNQRMEMDATRRCLGVLVWPLPFGNNGQTRRPIRLCRDPVNRRSQRRSTVSDAFRASACCRSSS